MVKKLDSTDNIARKVGSGLLDNNHVGIEHSGVPFVDMFNIFATQLNFSLEYDYLTELMMGEFTSYWEYQ